MTEQLSDEIGTDRPESPPRRLCDILAFGVLAVITLRILISIASGIVRVFTTAPDLAPSGQRYVGDILEWAADFGDGNGVLLAAVALGLVWWQVRSAGTTQVSIPTSTFYQRRSIRLCDWMTVVWVLTATGSFVYGVGVGIWHWQDSDRWLHIVGSSGFAACYVLSGLIGAYASHHLRQTLRFAAAEDVPGDLSLHPQAIR